MLGATAQARVDAPGHQVIHVTVVGGYRPSRITARAGMPLRVVFHRRDRDACLERVVFSSPPLVRHLVDGAETTVELPAQPPGEVRFTCAMGRYHGRIRLVRDEGHGRVLAWRDRLGRTEAPLWLAVALWLCTLPFLAAAVLVFSLEPWAGAGAAALVLVASLAVCLLGFRAPGTRT